MILESTVFVLSLRLTSDDKNFWLWSSIVFCDVIDQKLITFASYSYVIILTSKRSLTRNDSDQQTAALFAVHVDSLSLVRSWMNTMLELVISSQKQNAIDTSSLNHRVDSTEIHHSQTQIWRRRESIDLR